MSRVLIVIFLTIFLMSCGDNKQRTSDKVQNESIVNLDNKLVIDDYPVTNEMLEDKTSYNSSHKKHSGQTYSYDKVWFGNDTLNQTLVFELYTDYHRIVTYHFINNDIPLELIKSIELHSNDGKISSVKQKLIDFSGLINQSNKISSSYFISKNGFSLGDTKQKAIDIYGAPEKKSIRNGFEKFEWNFIGDAFYDGKTDLKGKQLAKNSFGHQVEMYFKNGKLIAQILHNDIP